MPVDGVSRPILAPGVAWELLSDVGLATAEGVVAAQDGMIYLTDLTVGLNPNPGGTIYRYDPRTREIAKVLEPSGMANGLHVDRHNNLIICQCAYGGTRSLAKIDLATGALSVLADNFEGKHFVGPNDATSDAQGRIYFTDSLFNAHEPPEMPNAVYRYDPDGKLTRLTTDVLRPNGIEVSPDGTRLYVACSVSPHLKTNPHGPAVDKFGITCGGVAAYDLDADGNISNGRLFWKTEEAMADGMAHDTEGNLYIACHDRPNRYLAVVDPSGREIETLPLPKEGFTNQFGFGRGDDAGTLYVTTTRPWGLYAIQTTRIGHYF